jgi:hypothetical protein
MGMTYQTAKVWSGTAWVDLAVSVSNATQRSITNVSSTSYTLGSADVGKAIIMNNGSAITLTIPLDSTYNFVIGETFVIVQKGAGAITVTPTAGVTLRSLSSYVKTSGQYAEAKLTKISSNEWLLSGDISA